MGKRIAVLGSSGQIGRSLVDYLAQRDKELRDDGKEGYDIHGYDIVPGPLTSHVTDLSDWRQFNAYNTDEYDFIFFLAFNCGGSRYLSEHQHTHDYITSNAGLMVNVFDSLNKTKTPYIFSSSQMSNMTFSSYGLLKLVGEQYTLAQNGVFVKFWNVYGVESDAAKSHVITDFIEKADTTGVIDMLTDGTEERQFLYVDDCCRALETLMLQYDDIDRDKPLHITTFEWNTILDVANIIVSQFPDCQIETSENTDTTQQGLKNEPDPYIKELWTPEVSLEDGIKDIISKTSLQTAESEVSN